MPKRPESAEKTSFAIVRISLALSDSTVSNHPAQSSLQANTASIDPVFSTDDLGLLTGVGMGDTASFTDFTGSQHPNQPVSFDDMMWWDLTGISAAGNLDGILD